MKNSQIQINWNQAQEVSEVVKKKNLNKYNNLLDEIKTSSPEVLTASDFNYYAGALNDCNIRKKEYTPNEVRNLMLINTDLNNFDIMHTFLDDETDSIFDFY